MAAVASILSDEAESGIDVHRKLPKSFDKLPKDKWWRLFRKRHPELTYRTPETLSSARKNISLAVVKQWFHEAHDYLFSWNLGLVHVIALFTYSLIYTW